MLLKALALVALLTTSSCAHLTRIPPAPASGDVVHVTGFGEVRFGKSRADLDRHLNNDLPGCNVPMRDHPQGSLVFDEDGRLVLMWFDAPLKTPAGVTPGVPVSVAKKAYPNATELPAPAGSYRFDGLLVVDGEHGYLFLHDGETVRKAIAGYAGYLDRLFNTGFGVC